ncbi:AAA family ATPase [Candidatus Uabimicrobium amorphum]|uniref:Serine/threonine protein kinase n=1 Tax=Uabimicrobium amorphum TaxID=2596890 RepID=A0A5S9IJV3_UABAM|nr:AAA family ATPase [Candidatus Uabimicrobium amorphum]BBM82877.1 serine/threonine protein kinase [Candidatus Uabimicrobium amorphum]
MLTLQGYKITERIYEGRETEVFKGYKNQQALIFKSLKGEYPSRRALARFRREYEIVKNLDIDGIVEVVDLVEYRNSLVIVLKDFGGVPLSKVIADKKITIDIFFPIAIAIVKILGNIHKHNLIHKDIKPSNIIINYDNLDVKIADFGISTFLSREVPQVRNPKLLEGTLAYMSPEQTGWINRGLDYRTDFYSLGITFYQMLTSRLPFSGKDALELMHAQIAKVAPSPHKIEDIPPSLSLIVDKLMAKTVKERYQSARGLLLDLEDCFSKWRDNEIHLFVPKNAEISERFQLSEKLYGRDKELEILLNSFNEVSKGRMETLLVCGHAGTGKSTLIHEIYKSVLAKKGYFITGKFDQKERNVPYSGFKSAFKKLIVQILGENEEVIYLWRRKLLKAFADNGQVLIDFIPEIELIIGKQPTLEKLPGTESQNRFNVVFINFIRALAQQESPLVIFLDDLQWSDSGTQNLLKLLIDNSLPHLFLLGAYRDNEIDGSHPLAMTLESIEQKHLIKKISLSPLTFPYVNKWIADSLNTSSEKSQSFSQLIFRKTTGNPFFVKQFITTLYQDGILTFDDKTNCWQAPLEEIQQMNVAENVVAFMAEKLSKLPSSSLELIKVAATIGNTFKWQLLATVLEQKITEIKHDVEELVKKGFIFPVGTFDITFVSDEFLEEISFRFAHDKIQQAAYSLIEKEYIKDIHLSIGKIIAQKSPEMIFQLVYHMNLAMDLLSQNEKLQLVEYNLQAGKKAMSSAAYSSACEYFIAGRTLLPENAWENLYPLTLSLHSKAAECEHLNGNFENAKKLFSLSLLHVKSNVERADIYNIKITFHTNLGEHQQALSLGKEGLIFFGIQVPELPGKGTVLQEVLKVKWLLRGKKTEQLLYLPEMVDPNALAAMKLLMSISPSTFFVSPNLWAWGILKMLYLTLKYGNTPISAFVYVCYGIIVGSGSGNYKKGYDFGKLAIEVAEKYGDLRLKTKAFNLFGSLVGHWQQHAIDDIDYLLKAYHTGLECGDLMFACFSLTYVVNKMVITGKNLDEVSQKIKDYSRFFDQLKFQDAVRVYWGIEQMIKSLQDVPENALMQNIEAESTFQEMQTATNQMPLHWHYINQLQVFFIFGRYSQALEMAQKSQEMLSISFGTMQVPVQNFYHSLTLTAIYHKQSHANKRISKKILQENQKKMKKWAKNCPQNFSHKYLLVQAEIARINNDEKEKIIELYEQAIHKADETKYTQNKAIACELAAKFFLAQGKAKIARVYLEEACYSYNKWGAIGKVIDLTRKHTSLLPKKDNSNFTLRSHEIETTISTMVGHLSHLNINTVIKASQAISREISLDKLLVRLMEIALENAGAERGFLILNRDNQLFIEVRQSTDQSKAMLQSIPMDNCAEIPITIVNFVRRTMEKVVLHDAFKEGGFQSDPYVIAKKLKSVLCIPILKQNELLGIFYLENNLTPDVFTPDRLEVLEMISTQSAISIENAKYYEGMKQTQRELQQSETKYRLLMEQASDAILISDKEGNYLDVNSRACEIFGYEKKQFLQLQLSHFFPQRFINLAELESGKTTGAELQMKRGNGTLFPSEFNMKLISDGRIQTIIRDITERKRLEKEVLEISSREQQRVAQDLHDGLGQQLTGIKYLSEALARSLSEKSLDEATKMERISQLVAEAINSTRGMAKGLYPMILQSNGLTVALSELAHNTSKIPRVSCEFNYDSNIEIKDPAVANQLYRIAQEALNNAIKHGGAKNISISLNKENDKNILSVRDNGKGFPEHIKKGMGLNIMKYRAGVLGGDLQIVRKKKNTYVICSF